MSRWPDAQAVAGLAPAGAGWASSCSALLFQHKSVTSFSFCEMDAATPTGLRKISKTGFP